PIARSEPGRDRPGLAPDHGSDQRRADRHSAAASLVAQQRLAEAQSLVRDRTATGPAPRGCRATGGGVEFSSNRTAIRAMIWLARGAPSGPLGMRFYWRDHGPSRSQDPAP